mmetsp:Transcript_50047/g.160149  ORF Transcript_50047/g.160149 Transcript_50047/m.160149 type:complete len:212 (+) Transcript_50047:52-687(+)
MRPEAVQRIKRRYVRPRRAGGEGGALAASWCPRAALALGAVLAAVLIWAWIRGGDGFAAEPPHSSIPGINPQPWADPTGEGTSPVRFFAGKEVVVRASEDGVIEGGAAGGDGAGVRVEWAAGLSEVRQVIPTRCAVTGSPWEGPLTQEQPLKYITRRSWRIRWDPPPARREQRCDRALRPSSPRPMSPSAHRECEASLLPRGAARPWLCGG